MFNRTDREKECSYISPGNTDLKKKKKRWLIYTNCKAIALKITEVSCYQT